MDRNINYFRRLGKNVCQHYELYLLVLPAVIFFALFHYAPLYGIQIAFRNYYPGFSISESEFIGWDNFVRFFNSFQSKRVIWNTLRISLMTLILGFPGPILLALMLNHVGNLRYKKVVQTVSYAPYFISAVAMAGMINLSVGHEQILLLQNSLNSPTSEIISTYVYKMGLLNSDYGYSTAIGLFNSVVNLILLVSVNWISGKISSNSLW